jgi:hypothetical protein
MKKQARGNLAAMTSDPRQTGPGPDDLGDDEQESEIEEYQRYLDEPPDDLVIAEDSDDDAKEAVEWAVHHPRAASTMSEPDDESAEETAVRQRRNR